MTRYLALSNLMDYQSLIENSQFLSHARRNTMIGTAESRKVTSTDVISNNVNHPYISINPNEPNPE